ncbi:RNA methyltransferase [Mesopusillimonas faecipullorum]|nr:RNA methyltransferase [Mesopusillimonas faecipullorum]
MSDKVTHQFENILFIMHRPSHPGNVGAAARAIKTMGFKYLALVQPRDPDVLAHPEAIALASGATDVLEQAQCFETLSDALASTTLALALTARPRDLGPPSCDIRQAATLSHAHLCSNTSNRVAIILGTERTGLANEDIALCQRVCHIPANPEYSSLNVAQALQLAAWELRYALITPDAAPALPETGKAETPAGSLPASHQQVQDLIQHWEQALIAVDFLDPAHPKKLMLRMRHLLSRSDLTRDETDMLRGVCTAMIKTAGATPN